MNHPSTHAPEDTLLEFAYGELPAEEAHGVELHVQQCPKCAEQLEGMRGVRTAFSSLPAAPAPDAGLESLLAYGAQQARKNASGPEPKRRIGRWLLLLSSVSAVAVVGVVSRVAYRQAPEALSGAPTKAIAAGSLEEGKKDVAELGAPAEPVPAAQAPAPAKGAGKSDLDTSSRLSLRREANTADREGGGGGFTTRRSKSSEGRESLYGKGAPTASKKMADSYDDAPAAAEAPPPPPPAEASLEKSEREEAPSEPAPEPKSTASAGQEVTLYRTTPAGIGAAPSAGGAAVGPTGSERKAAKPSAAPAAPAPAPQRAPAMAPPAAAEDEARSSAAPDELQRLRGELARAEGARRASLLLRICSLELDRGNRGAADSACRQVRAEFPNRPEAEVAGKLLGLEAPVRAPAEAQ